MSLPPGFLDELRTRLSIAQVVGRKVMWDNRKSNPGKGDMWAPCPFHQEKTASFHVDDKKGYYYCFGCHAKGDAISFVRETENVGFMEAVQILAGEAGMPMPERDPRAQEKADRRSQLAEVMEQAVQFFRLQLKTGAGAAARDYLAGRGLTEEALDRWEIGFAPPGWSNLWEHLTAKGVDKDLILGAGLARDSDRGKEPYDTFRHRIMFPIRDARGRCIAFGGRAMDPDDNAKYLNSPETELFDKSRSLFNVRAAREAAGKGHDLIVAEGYMDVIALSEAGFKAAVAPLGTAVTEHQLAMMWRIAPEPIFMLDGDTAGQRAAERVVELALRHINGVNSVFFLRLPVGEDPDDFLSKNGPVELANKIETEKEPLVVALWKFELGQRPTETPEQKADLDKRLRARVGLIPDQDVARYYREALKQFRWERFRGSNWAPEYRRKQKNLGLATDAAKRSLLVTALDEGKLLLQGDRLISAIALCNPEVAVGFRGGLEAFEPTDPIARTVLNWIVGLPDDTDISSFREEARSAIGDAAIDRILRDAMISIHPAVRKRNDADIVLHELTHHIALVSARRSVLSETREAEEEIEDRGYQSIDSRLSMVSRSHTEALLGNRDDKAEYDTAPSGARIKKDERSAFDELLSQIDFAKGRRAH